MLSPPSLPDEPLRLAATAEYAPSEMSDNADYAPLLDLARDLFGVPTAFVSFVGHTTQTFVAKLGLDLCSTSRAVSFCAHAIAQEEILVVPDATADPRFCDNPLVVGPPHIRFYAGIQLRSPGGYAVGTLCLVDTVPRRTLSTAKRRQLQRLAAMVVDKLELRRLDLARQVGQVRFENIAATSPDGIVCADADGRITFWNSSAERMFGYDAASALGQPIDLIVPERMRHGHGGGLQRVAQGGAPRLVGRTIELVARRSDGSDFPIELSLSMWQEPTGAAFGAILRDISDRRLNEERLYHLAHHDPLTELPNRTVLRQRLEQLGGNQTMAALLLVDLDGFKRVNDELGHAGGDAVLREVAERLLDHVRAGDTVARLGGDEFGVLLQGVSEHDPACIIADSLISVLSQPIELAGRTVSIGASVGIALFPADGATVDELLSSADLALYQAKGDGRHCHRAFSSGLRQTAARSRSYDIELRQAYEQREFELFYQPQVRLSDGAMVGAEALLRWRHPVHGLLSPASFMTALETRTISSHVGDWVLRTACAQAAAWRAAGLDRFRIGVNLFGSQFRDGMLATTVRDVLAAAGLPGDALELEITENIVLSQDESMLAPLRALRDEGIGIALDDYGTGYASLSVLKRTPISRLKVDQSFVRGMCGSVEDAAIIRAILHLGHAFGFPVIAEGVETEAQAMLLKRKGCEEVQGYLYGRPMPAGEFADRYGLSQPVRSGAVVTEACAPI